VLLIALHPLSCFITSVLVENTAPDVLTGQHSQLLMNSWLMPYSPGLATSGGHCSCVPGQLAVHTAVPGGSTTAQQRAEAGSQRRRHSHSQACQHHTRGDFCEWRHIIWSVLLTMLLTLCPSLPDTHHIGVTHPAASGSDVSQSGTCSCNIDTTATTYAAGNHTSFPHCRH
jgi:hypothetical protein